MAELAERIGRGKQTKGVPKRRAKVPAADAAPAASVAAPVDPSGFDYSRHGQRFNDAEKFAQFAAGYPDKSGIMAYIYRVFPKIDHSRIGITQSYLLKTHDPAQMTYEFISGRWGRGEYQIRFNDVNRAAGQQDIARTKVEVTDPDLVPIYDPRTLLVRDPANADEVSRLLGLGVLVRDPQSGEPRPKNADDGPGSMAGASFGVPAAAPAAAPAPTLVGANDLLSQIALRMMDRAFTPADSVLDQSFKIAERLNPAPAPAPSLDEIADAVARRLTPESAGGIDGEIARYERMESFLTKVGAGRSGAGPSAPANWATAVAALPGILSGLSGLVPEVVRGLAFVRAAGAGSPAIRMPAAGAQNAHSAPVENSGPAHAETGPGDSRALSVPETGSAADLGDGMGEKIVQVALLALEKQAAGVSGFDFANWLCGWQSWGLSVYKLLEQRGTEGCMGFLSVMPQGIPIMADPVRRAAIEAWLDDFFTFDSDAAAGAA